MIYMEYKRPFVIAEAGCNHMGQMEIAHEMINEAAVFCKVDAIKFQKRCPKELLTEEQYNAPHPNPANAFGKTYGEHREFLEFTVDQHAQLKEWCEKAGITYATSVWDMTSAKEIASLDPAFIKIPSACNTHYEMLQWLCDNYKGEIQLSFGMTTHAEEDAIIKLFEDNGRAKVIGSQTFGKGISQEVRPFADGYIQLTTGHFYTPSGNDIHHVGIAPDMVIEDKEYSEEELEAFYSFMSDDSIKEFADTHEYSKENIISFAEEHIDSGVPEDLLMLLIRNEYLYRMDYSERPVADPGYDEVLRVAIEELSE